MQSAVHFRRPLEVLLVSVGATFNKSTKSPNVLQRIVSVLLRKFHRLIGNMHGNTFDHLDRERVVEQYELSDHENSARQLISSFDGFKSFLSFL